MAARIREFLIEGQAPRVEAVHGEFREKFHRDMAHLEFLEGVTEGWG